MQKHTIVLMTAAFVLVSGVAANAQQNPSGPSDQSQSQQRRLDQDRGGMMRGGMMGGMEQMGVGPGGMMSPMMMRMIFVLMDTNGDGTISLQEFQAAHERIFKAMDDNKDGKLTLEEMQAFMRGMPTIPQRQ
jgi:Ca2+-binding EF-hand superfamily protein